MPHAKLSPAPMSHEAPSSAPQRGRLGALLPNGQLQVLSPGGANCLCDWLETGLPLSPALSVGDPVLFISGDATTSGVVLGRIGHYQAQPANQVIQASESLTLRCGESTVDLRADGKVLIRGDDVLVRAKGTQRIRAGSVSIN